MLARLKRLTAPPIFAGDEDQTRVAGLLGPVLNAYTLALIVFVVSVLAVPVSLTLRLIVEVVIIANLLTVQGLQWIMRRGRTLLAGLLLALVMSASVTLVLGLLGSVRAPVASLYVVTIVVAGLFGGRRALPVIIGLDACSVLGLILAERAGLLPPPDRSVGFAQWVTFTAVFGITATLIHLAQRALNDALARTQQELAERKQAEAALQRYATRLGMLHKIDSAILAARSPQEVAAAALSHIHDLMTCERAGVILIDRTTHEIVGLTFTSPGEASLPAGRRWPLETLARPIGDLGQGQVVRIDAADLPDLAAGGDLASGIMVPLRSRGELIGSLELWQTAAQAKDGFSAEQEEIAREVADDISIALQQGRLFDEVLAGRERLQALSRRLVEVQEEERRHIARELHDEVGQALTGLKLILQALPRLAPETAAAKLRDAIHLVNELTEHTHDLALDLRPAMLDDFGLVSALLWLFDRYQFRTGIRVAPEFVNLEQRLPPDVETTGYRIVQEALTNVARYAGVAEVVVRLLRGPTTLRIQVQDAGSGFDVTAALAGRKRAGLAGMHERAALLGGWVRVESAPSAGTQVMGVLPLTGQQQAGA